MGSRRKFRRTMTVFVLAVFSGVSALGVNFYKTSKIEFRNKETGSMARAVSREIDKQEAEKQQQLKMEQQKKFEMESAALDRAFEEENERSKKEFEEFAKKAGEAYENAAKGDFSFGGNFEDYFAKESEQENSDETAENEAETEQTEEAEIVELPDEYYVFGTVDSSGCYADAGVLYDERERLYSISPSEVAYNWAVFVKDGETVEAWTSTETLTEADLRPYTKEEQKKQYGFVKGGGADKVTGYWHTPF